MSCDILDDTKYLLITYQCLVNRVISSHIRRYFCTRYYLSMRTAYCAGHGKCFHKYLKNNASPKKFQQKFRRTRCNIFNVTRFDVELHQIKASYQFLKIKPAVFHFMIGWRQELSKASISFLYASYEFSKSTYRQYRLYPHGDCTVEFTSLYMCVYAYSCLLMYNK